MSLVYGEEGSARVLGNLGLLPQYQFRDVQICTRLRCDRSSRPWTTRNTLHASSMVHLGYLHRPRCHNGQIRNLLHVHGSPNVPVARHRKSKLSKGSMNQSPRVHINICPSSCIYQSDPIEDRQSLCKCPYGSVVGSAPSRLSNHCVENFPSLSASAREAVEIVQRACIRRILEWLSMELDGLVCSCP